MVMKGNSFDTRDRLKKIDLSSVRVGTFCAEPVSETIHQFACENICANYLNSYWGSEHGAG